MISARAMCLEASAAKRIISTAPIAKFGATNTLAPVMPLDRGDVQAGGPDHHVHAGLHASRTLSQRGVGRG